MNSTLQVTDFILDVSISGEQLKNEIIKATQLPIEAMCITINGKLLNSTQIYSNGTIRLCGKIFGGKGGFGSMLRAIGAQIEKTTNREACRDLSGRRLRDINEEKRLKNWLLQQKDREQEKEDQKKKKIERLLEQPKHEFKDESYQNERTNLTDKIADSLTQGLKRSNTSQAGSSKSTLNKKPRKRILLDEDLDAMNDTDDEGDDERAIALAT